MNKKTSSNQPTPASQDADVAKKESRKKEPVSKDRDPFRLDDGSGDKEGAVQKTKNKNKNRSRLFVYVALLAVVLLIIAGFLFINFSGEEDDLAQEVVFSIEDVEYTRRDIEGYIQGVMRNNNFLTDEDAIEIIKTTLVYHKAAKEYGVMPDNDLVEAKMSELSIPNTIASDEDSWEVLHVEYLVLVDMFEQKRLTEAKEGYAFVYFFASRVNQFGDQPVPESPSPVEGENDPGLIEQDREYARSVAEEHRRKLLEESMSPEEVYAEIMQDERLHEPHEAIPSEDDALTTRFGQGGDDDWREEVGLASLIGFIESYDEVFKPSDIQVRANTFFESDETYDAYYYFVYLTDSDDTFTNLRKFLERNGVQHGA